MAKTAAPVTVTTWAIANLERETADGFVFTAHYTVNAKDDTYSAGAYGSIGFERPENLIPFADLTEAEVVSWVQEALGADKVAEVEAALQNRLTNSATQLKLLASPGKPWQYAQRLVRHASFTSRGHRS
jgi:hypothetical protein